MGRAKGHGTIEMRRHRSSFGRAVLGAVGCFVILAAPARAQYTDDYQTNTISGVTSNWAGNYLVGSNTFADVLLVQDGGVLSNGFGRLGRTVSSMQQQRACGRRRRLPERGAFQAVYAMGCSPHNGRPSSHLIITQLEKAGEWRREAFASSFHFRIARHTEV